MQPIINLYTLLISKYKVNNNIEYLNLIKTLAGNPSYVQHDLLNKLYLSILKYDRIPWLMDLYDPNNFFKKHSLDNLKLLQSNWKICPLTKLYEVYNDKVY